MSQWSWWNKPPEPRYHGLINNGTTDYLNSVLQVLFMTEEFREAVNSPSEEHIDHHLKELFAELQQRSAYTFNILRALEVSNVNVHQDAAEYFERILRKTSENAAQIFHGQMSHRTTCSVCQTVTDSERPFWHLPLDLEGGENYSVENGINMFFTPTIFDGENQMYCDSCDTKVDADIKYVITHHPDVLLLLLKRFEFSYKYMSYIKITCNAEVPHTLRIPENQTYELYAVVERSGNVRSGHYIAIIKSNDDDGWYIFNDSSVTPLGSNPFPDNVNIAQSRDAYLLFYKRKSSVITDVCRDRDLHISQVKDSLQEDDVIESLQGNVSHIVDGAQNDSNIKQMQDEEGIKDSSLVETGGIEKEIYSQNERRDAENSPNVDERQKDRKSELDSEKTREKKNHKIATTLTGKHGAERDEETSQENLLADESEGLVGAEARGDGLTQTVKVDMRELLLRGEGKKKVFVKILEEETSSMKRKEINHEGSATRESDRGFHSAGEAINPREPFLTEQPNPRSKEASIGGNKEESRLNFDANTELKIFQERHNNKKKSSCKSTCGCS